MSGFRHFLSLLALAALVSGAAEAVAADTEFRRIAVADYRNEV